MCATVIGLMSRLRDFDGFTDGSSSSSSSWPQLRVVGTTAANMIGAAGVRDRAAAALTVAVRHLKGGDRELLEQVRAVLVQIATEYAVHADVDGHVRAGLIQQGAVLTAWRMQHMQGGGVGSAWWAFDCVVTSSFN